MKSTTPLNTVVFGVCLSSPPAVLMRFSYLKYNLIIKGSNAYRTNQRKTSLRNGLKTNLILFLAKPLKRVSIGRKCIFENSQKIFLWKLVLAWAKVSPVVLVKLWLIEILLIIEQTLQNLHKKRIDFHKPKQACDEDDCLYIGWKTI